MAYNSWGFSRNLLDIISKFEFNLLAFAYHANWLEFGLALSFAPHTTMIIKTNNVSIIWFLNHIELNIPTHNDLFVNECESLKCV